MIFKEDVSLHSYETLPAFYGIYGFLACVGLVYVSEIDEELEWKKRSDARRRITGINKMNILATSTMGIGGSSSPGSNDWWIVEYIPAWKICIHDHDFALVWSLVCACSGTGKRFKSGIIWTRNCWSVRGSTSQVGGCFVPYCCICGGRYLFLSLTRSLAIRWPCFMRPVR